MPHTRPTTDLAREALFNIIQNNLAFEDIKTLDLFGGTGCISYELASRGVTNLTIVEKDAVMYEFIKKTSSMLAINNLRTVRMDVFKFIDECNETFDFIFAGPPYALQTIDQLPLRIAEKKLLNTGGWFVLEHTPRNNYAKTPLFVTERRYGTTVFSIFVNKAE